MSLFQAMMRIHLTLCYCRLLSRGVACCDDRRSLNFPGKLWSPSVIDRPTTAVLPVYGIAVPGITISEAQGQLLQRLQACRKQAWLSPALAACGTCLMLFFRGRDGEMFPSGSFPLASPLEGVVPQRVTWKVLAVILAAATCGQIQCQDPQARCMSPASPSSHQCSLISLLLEYGILVVS